MADAATVVRGLRDEIRRSEQSRYDPRLQGLLPPAHPRVLGFVVSRKKVWGDYTSLICQDGTEAKRETILENQYRSLRDATKSGSRDILHPPPARPVGFVFMVEVANSRSDWRMKSSRTDPSGAQIGGGAPGTRTPRRCRLIGQRATTSNCQRAQSRRREGVGRDLHWVTAQLERVCVNLSIVPEPS